MNDNSDIFMAFFVGVALVFLEVALMLFVWNVALIPWFGLPSITYWQMFVIKIFINWAVPTYSSSKR